MSVTYKPPNSDQNQSKYLKTDVAFGVTLMFGFIATGVACGVIAVSPIIVPLGLTAILVGGVGGALFNNLRPSINDAFSAIRSLPNTIIESFKTPKSRLEEKRGEEVCRILREHRSQR